MVGVSLNVPAFHVILYLPSSSCSTLSTLQFDVVLSMWTSPGGDDSGSAGEISLGVNTSGAIMSANAVGFGFALLGPL